MMGVLLCPKCKRVTGRFEGVGQKWKGCDGCINKGLDKTANELTGINISEQEDRVKREMGKYWWDLNN